MATFSLPGLKAPQYQQGMKASINLNQIVDKSIPEKMSRELGQYAGKLQ